MLGGKARFHLKPYASRRVWIPRFNLETNIRFIEEYRKHPCLWNPDAADYMKHKPRFKAYEDIAKAMQYPGLDAASVRSKIKILRSCYISSRKQIASKAGTSTPHKPVDWFWAADSFLHDVIRLGFNEPDSINDEYRYLKQNFNTNDPNNTDQAEIFFGADMPVSSTVEVFDSAHDDIIGEEITDDADDETPSVNQNNAVSIKTEAAEDDTPDNRIYLELDDDQLMAIENGEMSIEEIAAKAEAAAASQQQRASIRQTPKPTPQRKPKNSNSAQTPARATPARQADKQVERKTQKKPSAEEKGEEIQSAESEPEDEFDVFGRCVAFQLKALPVDMALDLESQIHTLITKKRMDLLRKNKLHTHSQSDPAFAAV
ncbi:Alcohol dehydrogenase transcription factor Myb/SANT-like [Nesidiocoris tenuis]|uniref:Alcohol dehydrogenase transcription factor Myb/SANT-like n=1 Tax=Nesidiocoris tenuis TaxID=355587 RepID=A0ABN7A934_9HEMI|nr:Alcohol dehydrogenase transcription factor Myb/SANT-like [Nesidiocoris tenuis]